MPTMNAQTDERVHEVPAVRRAASCVRGRVRRAPPAAARRRPRRAPAAGASPSARTAARPCRSRGTSCRMRRFDVALRLRSMLLRAARARPARCPPMTLSDRQHDQRDAQDRRLVGVVVQVLVARLAPERQHPAARHVERRDVRDDRRQDEQQPVPAATAAVSLGQRRERAGVGEDQVLAVVAGRGTACPRSRARRWRT